MSGIGLEIVLQVQTRRAAKHHQVDQGVRPEAIGTMDADAGRFADGIEAGHHPVRLGTGRIDHLPVKVTGDSAHVVMHSRGHRQRLARQVDTGKDLPALGYARQSLGQRFGRDVVEMQVDMVAIGTDPASFAHFQRHRT